MVSQRSQTDPSAEVSGRGGGSRLRVYRVRSAYGYLPSKKNELQRELETRNLRVCAATVIGSLSDPNEWKSLEEQVLGGGELAGQLGGKYLVLIDGSYKDAFTGAPISPPASIGMPGRG